MAWRVSLLFASLLACAALLPAQGTQPKAAPPVPAQAAPAAAPSPFSQQYTVPAHTRIPLVLVNSVSTKTSQVGDQIYLQTSFPISAGGRIVIPEGSYVTGTITGIKRPGRVKGRGEIYIRFDTLMLRNGVKRDFRGTVSATDGGQTDVAKKEGTIQGDSGKGQDVSTVAGPTATGAIIGAAAAGGQGAGIGAGIGATAGMVGVLLTRGPDVRLLRGSSLEMQLDRNLIFYADEISFVDSTPPAALPAAPPPAATASGSDSLHLPVPF